MRIKETLNKKISLEDMRLYNKSAIAFFFMFIVPALLTCYLIFIAPRYITDKNRLLLYSRFIIICMSVCGLFGYLFLRRTIKALVVIIRKAKDLSQGNKSESIEVVWNDELKDLAHSFNKINSDLETKIIELEYSKRLTAELFQQISQAITSSQKMQALFNIIVQGIRKVMEASSDFIALYDKDGCLYLKAKAGNQKNLQDNMKLADDKGIIGRVIAGSAPIVVNNNDLKRDGQKYEDAIFYEKNIVCVPVLSRGSVKGVLCAMDKTGMQNITEEDVYLLENVASQIAVCEDNTELNRNIEETYYNTLVMLARIVEAKDVTSAGHLERVSSYVQMIADKLGIEDEAKKILKGGALLHDLGKVGIEDAILKKEKKLTKEEYEIMKQHTVIGENILKPLQSMSKLSTLVRHHHELYDGTGYPDGLKGEEIPLLARILTVADIYDAITTDRSYRKAFNHEEAINILKSYAGNKLDPQLVNIFVRLINEKIS